MCKACSIDSILHGFRDDIWFDDVDLEDIENATGKKVEVAPAMDKSTPLPQVSDIDKKIKEVRYHLCFHVFSEILLKNSQDLSFPCFTALRA